MSHVKNWNIKKNYTSGDDIVDIILENHGIKIQQDKNVFLNPPKISFWVERFSPELKKSLLDAKEVVNKAVKNKETIIIYGDYDADGISATAILYETLHDELGYENTYYFIPSRFKHGYGISDEGLDEINAKFGTGLIISVDTGITAVESVLYAKKLGFKVIITDHHQKPSVLPDADCIVWSDLVVGSGVSWILSRVLGSKKHNTIAYAALATVTDLQPVININRSILKAGLEVINNDPPLGLNKMLEVAGRAGSKITTYDLGFVIGPRLNASGRLVEAEDSLKLLLEQDPVAAFELATKLNAINITRQDKTLEMFEIASDIDVKNAPKILFSAKDTYHEGIIGLVAAKLSQKYYRPAVVISIFEGIGKGSARSIPGVNIIELLREAGDIYENIGGHPMAAGFSIKAEKLELLQKTLNELANKRISEELFVRVLNIDVQIPIELVGQNLYVQISNLEPYGIGNEEPVFCSHKLVVAGADRVGRDGQHLSLKLYKDGKMHKGIYFGEGENFAKYKTGTEVSVAYTLNLNVYNGKTYVDLMVKDVLF